MLRWVAALWLLVPALACADPVQDDIDRQPEKWHAVLEAGQSNARLSARFYQCPGDILPHHLRYAAGTEDCGQAPAVCLAKCLLGNGRSCFGIARSIETELDSEGDATLKFPFFMAGCAAGNANACTNAGASAKNGSWIGAPPQRAAAQDCQFRTYDASCRAGAAWGCFMLGMEWQFEGVNGIRDEEKARAAWHRACTLKPEGSACRAAQRRLDPG